MSGVPDSFKTDLLALLPFRSLEIANAPMT
jgi:hypothetical protein